MKKIGLPHKQLGEMKRMSHSEELDKKILKRLAEPPGGGSFREVIKLDSGEKITHQCSMATGWASVHWRHQYEAHFLQPMPEWVSYEHPYHRRGLCELAVESKTKLPDAKPRSSASRESAQWH